MKKYLIITSIILALVSPKAYSIGEPVDFQGLDGEEDLQEYFYRPPVVQETKPESEEYEKQDIYPLFKQIRIRLTNFYNEKEYKHNLKLIEKQKQEYQKELEEYGLQDEEITENDTETNISENNNTEESNENEVTLSEDTVQLEGGVKEQVTSKDAQLDADKIRFNEETMDIIATGKPVLYFPPQKTTIKAKKMVYNHASNILKAYEKVEVIKDGQKSYGDYLELNMNEEFGFLDNVKSKAAFLTVNARKAEMDEKQVILYDGELLSENSFILRIQTRMVGGQEYRHIMVPEDEKSYLSDVIGDTKVNVQSDEIIINAKKYNDVITLKKSRIRYGDVDLFKIPSMTFHTNRNHDYFEANYPEIGSRSLIGMYAGPGYVFDTPLQKGSTVKVVPIVDYNKGKFGLGGLLQYRSATNETFMGYTSIYNQPVVKGRQRLDDKLYFQYGANSYMNEWFLGHRMSKYNAELIYEDAIRIPSTFTENLGLTFRHRAGVGFMHDNDYKNSSDNFGRAKLSTTRFRYMAEIRQDLFKYQIPERNFYLTVDLRLQGSAAVYGTGDTQFIGRIAPGIETQVGRWFQSLRHYTTAFEDNSPMRAYDGYRYGQGSFYIREAFRVCKYLTVAWSVRLNTTNDAPNKKLLQENAFIVMIGPDDFKIHLGYDWEREQTYAACVIALDTKGSSLGYKKLVIKNPERLANNDLNQPELKVFDNLGEDKAKPKTKKRMMYAEVTDIEDPNREQL